MQPGDIVICINKDKLSKHEYSFIKEEITIGKQYKVLTYPPTNVSTTQYKKRNSKNFF